MIELREILSKIKPNRLSQQEQDLATGLTKNTWDSDKEIIDYYWPNNPKGNFYLSGLKGRLTSKLIPSILFYKAGTSYQAAYVECWREFAAVQVLKGIGLRKGAIWMAERLLKKAMQYDLTEIVVSISDILEINAARITGDRAKWNKYREINEKYEAIQKAEKDARRKLLDVSINFTNSQSANTDLAMVTLEYANELSSRLGEINSFQYGLYTYNLMAIHAQLTKDHRRLLEVCQEALQFFNNKTYPIPQSAAFSFSYKTITTSLQLRNFKRTKVAIHQSKEAVAVGSYNYGICLIYEAILGFHSNDPALIKQAIKHSSKYRKYPPIKEQWQIIEAFATFLDIDTGNDFRLAKFLNEVPVFSKDKRGNNIAILVVQILFYLKQGQKGKIIDRMEALKLYSQRYLRKDDTFRSNCFIHMLSTLPKANFHPVAVQRHAKKYVDQLSKYQSDEVEIIPYEELWGRVLEFLG